MYIIKCETDGQSRLDELDKCSGLVHWDYPEGWDGEGGGWVGSGWGTHVNPWLTHVNVLQKQLQYCKVISLQLIKINKRKKEDTVAVVWRVASRGRRAQIEDSGRVLNCSGEPC